MQQSTAPPPTFSMPVTVQSSNQSTLQFSNPGNALVTTSDVTSSSLTDAHLLSPQQPALQRNTVSPGLPQRPASAGERVMLCRVWRVVNSLTPGTKWPASMWGIFVWFVFFSLLCLLLYAAIIGINCCQITIRFFFFVVVLSHLLSSLPIGALLGGDLNNSNGGCPSPVRKCSNSSSDHMLMYLYPLIALFFITISSRMRSVYVPNPVHGSSSPHLFCTIWDRALRGSGDATSKIRHAWESLHHPSDMQSALRGIL